jgi:HAD superfamily hydrolase (TIGR01509 family)
MSATGVLSFPRRNGSMTRRYILWDHDGVLVDTERWFYVATRDVLQGLGIALSQETYLRYMTRGQSCWDLCGSRGMPDEEVSRYRELRDSIYQEHLRTQEIEVDGVADVLSTLSRSFEMGVVTTARREDFQLIHRSRDLLGFFRFVLTIEDYRRAKPHPDPYLAGLERFGARPEETVAVEDSARGLRSTLEAGIDCIVVRSPFTASQDFGGAFRVVDSIRQVPAILSDEAASDHDCRSSSLAET